MALHFKHITIIFVHDFGVITIKVKHFIELIW